MSKSDDVRQSVKKAYASAVSRKGTGCCGADQKGGAAKVAGYQVTELSALPEDAVTNSFGCGNPVAFAGVKEGDVVLDLGSGAGIDILLAAQKVGVRGKVIGIDMTDEMIEKAHANIEKSGLANLEVRKGIIEELPVEDDSVDWVISNCVINLSPQKNKVFKEIFRVLKPGGRISVSDIVVRDLPEYVLKSESLYNSCIAGAISEEAYLDGLTKAGLSKVKVSDRLVYDVTQLKAIAAIDDYVADSPQTTKEDRDPDIFKALAGNVWSARIYAEKPSD